MPRGLRRTLISLAIGGLLVAGVPASQGDLRSRANALQSQVGAVTGQLEATRGHLRDIEARIAALDSSLEVQRSLLITFQSEYATARARSIELRAQLARDRKALAAQLVAQYESPPANLVDAVLTSRGFTGLLERVDQMKRIAQTNAQIVRRVAHDKTAFTRQAARLAIARARQQRAVAAVLIERDQVASLRLAVLEREDALAGERARKQAELNSVRHQLAVLAARAAAAQRAAFATADVPTGGASIGGGEFGFFPAPGTNYSVGQEPEIASRLDALGKALHLHLIGISGYRTPQHSVEVGGFADDPHTRGEASDTPGVEGVPEATLLRFGLTRPFGGAAEADHIQLA
jgi:peptidoglycan hydrolase CwlO-like protein